MNECFFCGYPATEKHHIFGGANRRHSEAFGLVVHLCHDCHNEPPRGVHFNKSLRKSLQAYAQYEFEQVYGKEMFHDIFVKGGGVYPARKKITLSSEKYKEFKRGLKIG